MEDFTFFVTLSRLIFRSICFFSLYSSFGAVIIYQNNFNNLGSTPTQTELSSPQTIYTGFTSRWGTGAFYTGFQTRDDGNGGKALGMEYFLYNDLNLNIDKCKRLNITRISFKMRFPGTGNRVRLLIDGKPYGNFVDIVGDQFVDVTKIVRSADLTKKSLIQVLVSYGKNTDIPVIDDFTIYGEITDIPFHADSLIFPPVEAPKIRCPFDFSFFYDIPITDPYKSIDFSYDEASRAGGVKIDYFGTDFQHGRVTFPVSFQGETTVTAKVTACNNETISKDYKILTEPGGLPMSDMDLQASFFSQYNEDEFFCPSGTCGRIDNACYRAGSMGFIGFFGKKVDINVRFQKNVRYFEILGKSNFCNTYIRDEGDPDYWGGFDLYFTQSDFDNYSGALKLPKDKNDEEGKNNLRLLIVSDDMKNQDHAKIVPVMVYKSDDNSYWVVRYRMKYQECWYANAVTRVYLADAETSLPVKLESISAKSTPDGNLLTWKTTEETNFSHFEVENSEDPRRGFSYLTKIISGNNPLGGNYHYTHIPPSTSQQYYRLKMIDFDSTFEYSRIVAVGNQLKKEDLLVYPNPAQNLIFLESPDNIKSINLVDQKGAEILNRSFSNAGKSLSVPLPKLNSGIYYLKVNAGTDNQQVKKVLVK